MLKEIAQIIPEMRWLIRYDDGDYKPYRPTFFDEMEDVYLGLGNYAYINNEIFSKYISCEDLNCNIVALRDLIEKVSGVSLGEMFMQVKKMLKKEQDWKQIE